MNHWTDSARHTLEQFLKEYEITLSKSGDAMDVAEVLGDIRRHVEQELTADKFPAVAEDDVRRVLGRMGLSSAAPSQNRPPITQPDAAVKPARRISTYLWAVLGVLLPFIAFVIELVTKISAEIYLDPIPNWGYLTLVAMVPLVNLWLCVTLVTLPGRISCGWQYLCGMVLAVEIFYSALYLPILPFAVIGIVYVGIGFLPLSPLLSLIATGRLLALMRRHGAALWPDSTGFRLAKGGVFAALLLCVLFVMPWLTFHWTRQVAEAESSATARHALKMLRWFGDEDLLLRSCYTTMNRGGFMLASALMGGQGPDTETARRVYFQVTGRAFNAVPPPQRKYRAARWNYLDDWAWDADHGGTAVAARIKGLTLNQSRMDALANVENGWGYVEWIMEFKNTSLVDREARAQILLPPNAVVSRLTLWVNGEEREAAFAGSAEVRSAYQEVAVRQRRDPVLVTWCGKDRVLMQCFPVPRQGGTMKIRLGISAPWSLTASAQARLRLPQLVERNFQLAQELKHSVWFEATGQLEENAWLKQDRSITNKTSLHGEISDADLCGASGVIRAQKTTPKKRVQADDHRTKDGAVIAQELIALTNTPPSRIILLIDGGVDMSSTLDQIAGTISHLPTNCEIGAVCAKDGSEILLSPTNALRAVFEELPRNIRSLKCAGGQDNLTAMVQAWDWALNANDSAIIWIHGPQPVSLDKTESLLQRLLWRPHLVPVIYDLQVMPGPNRLAEMPEMASHLRPVLRQGGLREDLQDCLASLKPNSVSWKFERSRTPSPTVSAITAPKGPSHVVRLWAADEISKLIDQKKRADAVAVAAKYQLVTPVSGAVVLETKAQYDRAGLQAVESSTVPSVPEPSTYLLVLAGLVCMGLMRCRKNRKAANPC